MWQKPHIVSTCKCLCIVECIVCHDSVPFFFLYLPYLCPKLVFSSLPFFTIWKNTVHNQPSVQQTTINEKWANCVSNVFVNCMYFFFLDNRRSMETKNVYSSHNEFKNLHQYTRCICRKSELRSTDQVYDRPFRLHAVIRVKFDLASWILITIFLSLSLSLPHFCFYKHFEISKKN